MITSEPELGVGIGVRVDIRVGVAKSGSFAINRAFRIGILTLALALIRSNGSGLDSIILEESVVDCK